MTRHFLGLYLLIVLTLAVVSWGQDRLMQAYSGPDNADDNTTTAVVAILGDQLHGLPTESWKSRVADISARTDVDLELFSADEIAGPDTLERLSRGENAYMRTSSGDSWVLKRLDRAHVLALKSPAPGAQHGPLEWGLTIGFYGLIALVLMFWIWPLTRDLRTLENAAAHYGNRNWQFAARIKPHSQIYPLAETFRKMAARIDGLIASHKDMSNAVSHEIKTPLARMQFEIELAQQAGSVTAVRASLDNIKSDIDALNGLVKATLGYAILERADLALHLAEHNFTSLIPAIVESVKHDLRAELSVSVQVQSDAERVICDVHLFETMLRNLLYNAGRYATSRVAVTFTTQGDSNHLLVEDDGPGIPEQERGRVFQSFVQLDTQAGKKMGYGLGLAIVKRAIEWHAGDVSVGESSLGGASLRAHWPATPAANR